jgi:hypothetical protein
VDRWRGGKNAKKAKSSEKLVTKVKASWFTFPDTFLSVLKEPRNLSFRQMPHMTDLVSEKHRSKPGDLTWWFPALAAH